MTEKECMDELLRFPQKKRVEVEIRGSHLILTCQAAMLIAWWGLYAIEEYRKAGLTSLCSETEKTVLEIDRQLRELGYVS